MNVSRRHLLRNAALFAGVAPVAAACGGLPQPPYLSQDVLNKIDLVVAAADQLGQLAKQFVSASTATMIQTALDNAHQLVTWIKANNTSSSVTAAVTQLVQMIANGVLPLLPSAAPWATAAVAAIQVLLPIIMAAAGIVMQAGRATAHPAMTPAQAEATLRVFLHR